MEFIKLFSNREISFAVWNIIFILWIILMTIKSIEIRKSVFKVFKAILNKHIIFFMIVTVSYAAVSVWFLSSLSIWNWMYLKDVVLWFLFIGIPMTANAASERNIQYFVQLVKENMKIAIFIEFLVGTFTFNLYVELLLVPISTLIFLLYTVSSLDKSYKSVEKFFSVVLSILGWTIIFFAIRNMVIQFSDLNIPELFVTFSIPITMTFIFLPLSYLFSLYSGYEQLFLQLKFRIRDRRNRKLIALKIIRVCNFSISKVEFFRRNYIGKFYLFVDKNEINNIITSFKNQYSEERKNK
ncbi:hypothetical protein DFR56_12110 [Pseudogracilibacillus auburnensis]|uniref:Uncharacterized protein n=2 Tax=Pseudogracilibacillus auburnensis TaxID=1494959 RepID=A0A2V3VI50_9BACI|nr:hypothetical protein DFR56_12110 [Pseudogracilibacillus auburnensis]